MLGRRHQGQSFGQTLQYEPGATGHAHRRLTFATLHEVHQHATLIVFPLTKTTLESLDPLQLGGVVLHEPAKRAQISLRGGRGAGHGKHRAVVVEESVGGDGSACSTEGCVDLAQELEDLVGSRDAERGLELATQRALSKDARDGNGSQAHQ